MATSQTQPISTIDLSPAQEQIISHRGAPLQIVACAGSGKTESISRRIASLIVEGADPASIIAFTFTEKAAAELKQRVVKRVEEKMGREFLDRLGPMFVGTIHGYCFRLLQLNVPQYGNHDVLDEHRHAGLLSREYKRLGLSKLGSKHWEPIRDFIRSVDVISNEVIDPAALDGTPLGECYREYRDTLDRYHFLSYGLLITCAIEALEDPAIYEKIHGPLRHLIVDEYQDINPAQERLIELLARDPVQICVVGDDDQSIYQWRGSDISNILKFQTRRSTTRAIVLADNRRSRPQIVRTANAFASSIPGRLPKQMQPSRPAGENEIVAWSADTAEDEADQIAETIERIHAKGYRYRDIAVLFRSVRTSAPPLIDAFRARNIPFACGGRTGLFLHPEISYFGELFSWIGDGDWRDARFEQKRKADIDRIVAGLDACFGNGKPIPGLKKYMEDWKTFVLRTRQPVSLVGDFYKLLYKLGAESINLGTQEGAARFGAFARFSQLLADFEHVTRRGRYDQENGRRVFRPGQDGGKFYFQRLANYLIHYAFAAYEDYEGEPASDLDAVSVMTVHQAKGLEWPVVLMPALVKGRFPTSLCGRPQEWLLPPGIFSEQTRKRYEGSETEERRLFYVALTRARDCVYLSYFQRKKNKFKPSPLLTEVAGTNILAFAVLPLPGTPEPAGQKEIPPLQISFSHLAAFEDCGLRYQFGTVFGFQQELAVELGYGRAIHHVLRRVAEEAQSKGSIPTAPELKSLVDAEFYLPFANTPAFEQMYRSATRMTRLYVNDYSGDLMRVWAVERPFELHFEDGIVAGRADVILDRENDTPGALAIVDYKVTHDPEREERYRRQLSIYTAAGRGEGLRVDAAYLHDLSDSARRPVEIGPEVLKKTVQEVSISVKAIRRGKYEANPEEQKCRACEFLTICAKRACRVGD